MQRISGPLLDLIPGTAKRILDVGCAEGESGPYLRERIPGVHITGIEIDPEAAAIAREALDIVYVGDAVEVVRGLPRYHYDAIILGDVIEHLMYPDQLLVGLKGLLAQGGRVYTSVPNVQHRSVVGNLIGGEWQYTDGGILSQHHKRFFTKKSLERLFAASGFWYKARGESRIQMSPPHSGMKVFDGKPEFNVYQFYHILEPRRQAIPKTMIVIPVHNLHEMTQKCIESIDRYTPQPHTIVVVDNGSDPAWGWTRPEGLSEQTLVDWAEGRVYFRNETNAPFAEACNQGIEYAMDMLGCGFVVLLNNDTIVTEGWLGRLIAHSERPGVGIVGPMTNLAAGVQKIPDTGSPETCQETAKDLALKMNGKGGMTQAAVGFCMLIKSAVIKDCWGLDEKFVNGFEEVDFCLRAKKEGWLTAIARDTFVYHWGNQTFRTVMDADEYWKLIESNYETFKKKWPGLLSKWVDSRGASAWFFRPEQPPKVFWAVLFERNMFWQSADALMDVAGAAAMAGYHRLAVPFRRVNSARNQITLEYLIHSSNPKDVLIMLDADHFHPMHILTELARRKEGVVAALAFRRGPPYDPLFFSRHPDGTLLTPAEWETGGYYKCAATGSGAIAIKRWVFDKLEAAGEEFPFFRFEYFGDDINSGGEDLRFARLCEDHGISQHCDTGLEIPHMVMSQIDQVYWEAYMAAHPEILTTRHVPAPVPFKKAREQKDEEETAVSAEESGC